MLCRAWHLLRYACGLPRIVGCKLFPFQGNWSVTPRKGGALWLFGCRAIREHAPPGNFEIWAPWMAENALEIFQIVCFLNLRAWPCPNFQGLKKTLQPKGPRNEVEPWPYDSKISQMTLPSEAPPHPPPPPPKNVPFLRKFSFFPERPVQFQPWSKRRTQQTGRTRSGNNWGRRSGECCSPQPPNTRARGQSDWRAKPGVQSRWGVYNGKGLVGQSWASSKAPIEDWTPASTVLIWVERSWSEWKAGRAGSGAHSFVAVPCGTPIPLGLSP